LKQKELKQKDLLTNNKQSKRDRGQPDGNKEPIWQYGDLKKSWFYVAVPFFDATKPLKSTSYVGSAFDYGMSDNPTGPTNQLLDHIALLFARYRKCEGLEAVGGAVPDTSDIGSNVTATALQLIYNQNDSRNDLKECVIWIAKNAGLRDFDGKNDEDMMQLLNSLLNDSKSSSLPGKRR
jgi:hypothetical protein